MESGRRRKGKRRSTGQWAVAWRKFKRDKAGLVGLSVVVFLFVIAIFHDQIALYPQKSLQSLYEGESGEPPSWKHPFGTTNVGTDMFSETVHATMNDLFVGIVATGISLIIALIVGAFSGYVGGNTENVLMRITEMFLVFPAMMFILVFARVLILFVVAGFGLVIIVVVLGIFGWASNARMIRGEVLRVKSLEFIRAEIALGASRKRIIFRHILPNIFANLAVVTSYGVALNILMEAGIGFLGFGDPNTITWGLLMQRGFTYVRLEWWGITFPGLAVFLSVFGFNLLGDGLNNALNPKLGD